MNWSKHKKAMLKKAKNLTRKCFPVTADEANGFFNGDNLGRYGDIEGIFNKSLHECMGDNKQSVTICNTGPVLSRGLARISWHNTIPVIWFTNRFINPGHVQPLIRQKDLVRVLKSQIVAENGTLSIGDYVLFTGLSDSDMEKARAGLELVFAKIMQAAVYELRSELEERN